MIYKNRKHQTRDVNPRNKQRKWSRFLFWFALIIFIGVMIYVLFFSSFLFVTKINISGEKNIGEEEIRSQIDPEMKGKIWKIINRNNLFLVNRKKIEKKISNSFRLVRDVHIKKKFPSELDVQVVERIPSVLFHASNGKFLLDENSVAYDTADPEADTTKAYGLVQFSENGGKNVNLGETVFSEKYQTYLLGIGSRVEDGTNIALEKNFQTPSLVSDDIRAMTKEGWGIYFNENIDLKKEIDMLGIVLDKEIPENQRPDLEYIDLRIDNKVYYKFKDGTPEEIARLAQTAAEQVVGEATVQPSSTPDTSSKDKKKK